MFESVIKSVQRINTKRLVIAAGFSVAMVAAIGLGLATKQYSQATATRDCSRNSIDYDDDRSGGCGALSREELIADIGRNVPGDLPTIYADPLVSNLSQSEYTRFASTAQKGTTYLNGDVKVDGQTVLTGASSMGRQTFNGQRKSLKIGGKTYYYSQNKDSFAKGVTSIPVMVMFDAQGAPETVIMTACGNPVWGTKVVPIKECKALNHTKISEDTYDFSTNVFYDKGATVKNVVYDFGDGTTVTKTNPKEVVRHKYARADDFTAKVTVTYNLPGNQLFVEPVTKCATKITVVQPYYTCVGLIPAILNNDKKTQFRFTAKTSQGNGATLKDVDFTLDGTSTTTGVVTKDAQGNIYKEYTFAEDGKSHKVVAKVNFNLASGVTSKTCEASVEAGKTPMCTVPGKENFPPESPECYKCDVPGKEDLPKDKCVETPVELPHTGMGNMFGLFAGTSAFGAVAHRVVAKRRARS
jgi:hypothetical protein